MQKEFPTLSQAVILFFLTLALQLLIGTALGVFLIAPDMPLANNVLAAAARALAFSFVIYIGLHRSDFDLLKALFTFEPSVLFISALLFATAGLQVLLSEADNLFRQLVPMPQTLSRFFEDLLNSRNARVAAGLLVIVAPLTEETLLRGLFLHGFLRNYSTLPAVLLSGLLYALLHLNPWQFTGAFILGTCLAYLYARTRSLSACILVHALYNGLPLICIHLLRLEIPVLTTGFREMAFQPLWLDLAGAGALAMGGLLLFFALRKRPARFRGTLEPIRYR